MLSELEWLGANISVATSSSQRVETETDGRLILGNMFIKDGICSFLFSNNFTY